MEPAVSLQDGGSDESRKNILFGFITIAAIFTLPIIILFYFMVRFKTDNIVFASKELVGLRYQAPLQELLINLGSHKIMSLTKRGDFSEIEARIRASILRVKAVDAEIGALLQFTNEGLSIRNRAEFTASNLEKKWDALVESEGKWENQALAQEHDELLKHLRVMIAHLGDTSNLILDPDLDSYYLMDVTLLVIPQLQDHLDRIATFLLMRDRTQQFSSVERAEIGSFLSLLRESDMDRLRDSASSAVREDLNFYGTIKTLQELLPTAVEKFSREMATVETYLEKISKGKKGDFVGDDVSAILGNALLSSGILWNIAARELKLLLENRIEWQTSDRTRALFLTIVAWFVSLMTVIIVCRSTLRKQEALTQKIKSRDATIISASKLSALGEMAGNVAHEINTPIATIHLTSEQGMDVLGDDKPDLALLREMLKTIYDTSSRIGKIVLGMRKFSRDAGSDAMKTEKIKDLVHDTLVLCQESIKSRSIRLEIDPIGEGLSVACRSVEVSQVLLNLLNNAIAVVEQLPDPWIKISIQDLGNTIEIGVSDSGEAIKPEVRNKLFTPFFTTKPVGVGTGLGLAISKKIIENHGGTLSFDQVSLRTRFVMNLPKSTPSEKL